MIARPKYSWTLAANIDTSDDTISIEIDIEMLERIKSTMRTRITEMAESCNYTNMPKVLDAYLKLEKLSVIYHQVKEEQKRKEEEQNNDVLPETETTEQ